MIEPPHGAARRLAFLFKLVGDGPSRFSLGDLAARADLPQSTVHRNLQALIEFGLVERSGNQSYRIGREFYRIASNLLQRFDLVRSAQPLLAELVADWHETAVLCSYSPIDRRVVIAASVCTPHPLRFAIENGMEIGLVWGSLGRAVLAFLSPNEIEVILRDPAVGPLTGRRRMPREAMMEELETIRQRGFSRYYDPRMEIAGIAAPVFGSEDEVLGCVGVTMPSSRYRDHLEDDLAEAVCAAAKHLTLLAQTAQGVQQAG
ncbi:IclR family transcriptional regulator [Novosphingobium sp.]|uniref:IclR family transcriptional regulator n=1 Tax=Novosphingobium sp. TaxID=1874826 RepID=UPI0035B0A99E